MIRRAKMIATLGPASSEKAVLSRLFEAGVDVVRLNLSHGSSAEHRQSIARIRSVAQELGLHVPILLDLMGPRYRLGEVPNGPRYLLKGDTVTLSPDASDEAVPLGDSDLLRHLEPDQRLLIDGGLVELRITRVLGSRAEALVITGGPISTRKGINLPDTDLPFEVSDKDRRDIELAIEEDVDYVAASYIGQASDLTRIRKVVEKSGGRLPIMAKLERARGVRNLQEIVAEADAVMVARGDLGVEVPLHRVPVLQKQIIDTCLRAGKPVIVATQMLESMTDHHSPTRAETSDVANAVLDGADGMLLSGETAIGRFPAETVETMARIICEAEAYARQPNVDGAGERADAMAERAAHAASLAGAGRPFEGSEIADAMARAAVFTAANLGVRQIVTFTRSGFTARLLSRYRPRAPILAFTPSEQVARRSQILWGTRPFVVLDRFASHGEIVERVERQLLESGNAAPGDKLILLMKDLQGDEPGTNLMRLHEVAGS
jgi:pyruvate kinase